MKFIKSSEVSLLLKTTILCLFLQSNVMIGQSQKKVNMKHEIKEALRLETSYFYQRDLAKWEGQWSHKDIVMKCYFREGKYEEQLGWSVIRKSAKNYMTAHPEPEQPPTDVPEYEIAVFEKSAFVSYIAPDSSRGKKREIRLLVRENGKWKISYMSTNYFN